MLTKHFCLHYVRQSLILSTIVLINIFNGFFFAWFFEILRKLSALSMDHQYIRSLGDDNNEIEYNAEKDELLIDLVKAHPHLYDKKHPSFKDVSLKNSSWGEISSAANLPIEYCMHRWSRLRERYAKLSKYNNLKEENHWKKTFQAYESLNFLNPHIKRRKRFVVSTMAKQISPKQVVQVTKQRPVTYYVNCGLPSSTVSTPTVLTQGTKLVIPGKPSNTYLVSNVISNKKQENNYATVLPKVEESEMLLNNDSEDGSNSGNVISPELSFEEDNSTMKDGLIKAKKMKIDYFTLFVGEELAKLPENVRKEKKKKIFAILME